MKTIKEWDIVQELNEIIDELRTEEQQKFIIDLFTNLDPHFPFLEQCSEKQQDWLYTLHDYYCNGNEDAFDEYEDEYGI